MAARVPIVPPPNTTVPLATPPGPTLIVPPLATRKMVTGRLAASWMLGAAGYAAGLTLSTMLDLPSGPVIVWVLVALALAWHALPSKRTRSVAAGSPIASGDQKL